MRFRLEPHVSRSRYLFLWVSVVALAWPFPSNLAWAREAHGDLLLFPELQGVYRPGLDNNTVRNEADILPALNIFGTFDFRRIRSLAEIFFDRKEHEVERAQIGLQFDNTTVWLGRYHNPIGIWNPRFHHGAHQQTSISRPAVVEYEDRGGPLPTHLAGLLVEGVYEKDRHGLVYSLGVGAGPELETNGLDPWNIFFPAASDRGFSGALRLAYQPQAYGDDEYGLSFYYSEIPVQDAEVDRIRQYALTAFGVWESAPFRVLGEAYFVGNEMRMRQRSVNDFFASAFVQAEYKPGDKWTFYTRGEGTIGNEHDGYLAMFFPNVITDRILGGVHFRISRTQVIKFEASAVFTENDEFGQLAIQWAALF